MLVIPLLVYLLVPLVLLLCSTYLVYQYYLLVYSHLPISTYLVYHYYYLLVYPLLYYFHTYYRYYEDFFRAGQALDRALQAGDWPQASEVH